MTLDEMIAVLDEQSAGDGMALMRFVLPGGAIYEPAGGVEQVSGCPSTVTISLIPAGPVREDH